MRLKSVKVANAVKTSIAQENFLSDDKYELTLTQGVVITIKSKKDGKVKCTSLFNVVEWEPLEDEAQAPAKARKGST